MRSDIASLEHLKLTAPLIGHKKVAVLRGFVSLGAPVAALACALGSPATARAEFIPPAGEYRLIFVTAAGTTAASSSIADYNNFATAQAALNGSLPSTTWTAVASTDGIAASANIACTPDCSAIPIFLVDGTEVAASSNALFNAATTSLNASINEDQFGSTYSGYVWTGSASDGTQAIFGSVSGDSPIIFDNTLGSGGIAEIGFAGATNGNAIDIGGWGVGEPPDGLTYQPIYAISGVIGAPTNSPEPMTASLLGFGGLVTGLVSRLRRRRMSARLG